MASARTVRNRTSFLFFILTTIVLFLVPCSARAQEEVAQYELEPSLIPVQSYTKAEVIEVLGDEKRQVADSVVPYQILRLRIIDGPEEGDEVVVEHMGTVAGANQIYRLSQKVLLTKIESTGQQAEYYILDTYRLPWLWAVSAIFLVIVLIFVKGKGLRSLLGLGLSILVLSGYVVPCILAGADPILTSLIAGLAIAVLSLYLAHGLNRRTTIALLGMVITLGLATGLALLFVNMAQLRGLGSEESVFLQVGHGVVINLKGLLLGGIIIGMLGVLDDVTTTQAAVVQELKSANSTLSLKQLYRRGLSVGREHIVSLVNTLALAYAGASFPIFLLFAIDSGQPLWVTFNNEFIAEEIVRTLVGSTALILAVPITTLLAAWFFSRTEKQIKT